MISYSSRHLNAAEWNCSAIEREALAIVYGIKRYRHYLQDDKFEIISDHRPLRDTEVRTDFTENIIEEQRKDETCSNIRRYLEEGILSEQDE